MKNKIILASLLVGAILMSGLVMAHSGGTNSIGCHTDHSTGVYHCH